MTVLLAAAAGYLAGRLVLLLVGDVLRHPVLERSNYRGRRLPTAGGIVIPIAAVVVEAGRALAGRLGLGEQTAMTGARASVLIAVVGYAALGLLDDVLGDEARGFRGHLRALSHGRATTGAIKLVGGSLLAIVVASSVSDPAAAQLVADAALVACCANLGNLFDRAPGRADKVSLMAFVALAVLTQAPTVLTAAAVVVGAGAALLIDDLHERLMLGDTGANALGAVVGLAVVQSTVPRVRLGVLVAVLVANVASELVSFSKVIEAVPPLRALDRVGRRG